MKDRAEQKCQCRCSELGEPEGAHDLQVQVVPQKAMHRHIPLSRKLCIRAAVPPVSVKVTISKARQLSKDVQDALKREDEHEERGGKECREETDEDLQEGHRMTCLNKLITDDWIDILLHRQVQHDTRD